MEVYTIIDTLIEYINKSTSLPLSRKCLVDRNEMLEVITAIKHKLPEDIKQAKWLKDERQRILADANHDAEVLLKQAEAKIAAMTEQHEITQSAMRQAEEIIAAANKNAREIRIGAKNYADTILEKVEARLKDAISVIHENREELK